MMSKDKHKDGRRDNQPPEEYKFRKGQSGNPAGRPRKKATTFEDEIKAVFGTKRRLQINGKIRNVSMRQIILEQMAQGAAKGSPTMMKLSFPFIKNMDDAPEFEVLPEDKKALKDFRNKFNKDGSEKDEY